jgi:hypothetical protein
LRASAGATNPEKGALEVGYEASKSGKSRSAVKKAVKKVGNSRKRFEKQLGR